MSPHKRMAVALRRRLSIVTDADMMTVTSGAHAKHMVAAGNPRQQRRLSPVEETMGRARCGSGCFPASMMIIPFSTSPRVYPSEEWWVQRFDGLIRCLAADLREQSELPWEVYRGRRGPLIRYELSQYALGSCLMRLARVTCVHCGGAERERLMALRRMALRAPPSMHRLVPKRSDSGLCMRPRPADGPSVMVGICCEGLGPENMHADMAIHTFMDNTFDVETLRMRAIITRMCFT